MVRSLALICAVFATGTTFAIEGQNDPDSLSVVDKAKVQAWMTDARHKMFERDWRGALGVYREVLVVDKNNGKAEYRTAECQYNLTAYKFALKHIDRAKNIRGDEINKEFDYTRGKILFKLGKVDEAKTHFEKFRDAQAIDPAKDEEYRVHKWIKDCDYAKAVMSKPVEVEIRSLSDNVNSRYREYGAVPSPDGKEIYFTSRRNNTVGGSIAVDHVYYSDVYVTKWNEEDQMWDEAEHAPGRVNDDQFDAITDIYKDDDGTLIMYLTLNVNGYTKSSDIATSKLSSKGTWGKPRLEQKRKGKKGGLNSSFFESSATITADGTTMYFVGEGLKGQGQADIYMTKKERSGWTLPVNLGATINSPFDEKSVWVTPDGNHLFFSTNGREGAGGFDVYVSHKSGDGWTEPKNLGFPINGVDDETHFRLSPDGKTAYLTSIREGGKGFHDIYIVDLKGYDVLGL